jgi:hypothetical protein
MRSAWFFRNVAQLWAAVTTANTAHDAACDLGFRLDGANCDHSRSTRPRTMSGFA